MREYSENMVIFEARIDSDYWSHLATVELVEHIPHSPFEIKGRARLLGVV